jgi:DNA-binding XRE family transcriptional regulator
MKNIIYGLYCPYLKIPVYIGKTTQGLDRPFNHISDKSHNEKIKEWVSLLKKENKSPAIVVLEYSDNAEILIEKEKFWVQKFINEGFVLLNQTLIKPNFFIANEFSIESLNTDPLIEIRNFIKIRRRLLKITQKELAQKAGVGLRFLRELEQTKKVNFNTSKIQSILNLFGKKLTIT